MKVLVVYVGKEALPNFAHSTQTGVWGFMPNMQPDTDFGAGDVLLFASGYKGNIRFPVEKCVGNLTMVATAEITTPLYTERTPHWPNEIAESNVLYPKRFKFTNLRTKNGLFPLSDARFFPQEVKLAIRRTAIGGKGQVVEIGSLPDWLTNHEAMPRPDDAPPAIPKNPTHLPQPAAQAGLSVPDTLFEIGNYIAARGFAFPPRVLQAFYAALRSKPFVILAGNSGTGKSRLVRLFAEASGANIANGQFTMIPVRPDWNDSSELLGYFDLNGDFIAGQLIAPILMAHQNPKKPFFVCLDEMNLARVEHYFSDFLSIVESRRRDSNTIATDPILRDAQLSKMKKDALRGDVLAALEHLKGIGKPLGLPDNLYVVGTVNMDETTQPFSRKVLDRANTIEFSDVDLMQGIDEEVVASEVPPLQLDQSFYRSEFTTLNDLLSSHREKAKQIAEMISDLNRDLGLAGFEVGYRVRDEAISFAVYASSAGMTNEEVNEAIVLQKILPRVHGSSPRVEKLLMSLLKRLKGDSDAPDENDPELAHKLAALRVDSEASAIVRKIAGMLILFREENFTSFWLA
jgi:energy-coupling factor transporter ATP-binding protein EcfA2